jgi:hypothetical protein
MPQAVADLSVTEFGCASRACRFVTSIWKPQFDLPEGLIFLVALAMRDKVAR